MTDERYKLLPSTNWRNMDFKDVNEQFHYNLKVFSDWFDRMEYQSRFERSKETMRLMKI